MELTKPESFAKQIALFFNNGDFQRAYELAQELIVKFPDEMLAHFLLAQAAYRIGRFEDAKMEGRKAFNIASEVDDMIGCALITASAYYSLGEYQKGYELLEEMEKKKSTEEIQSALMIFSLAMENPKEAILHLEKLYGLNKQLAMDMAAKMLEE